MTGETCPEDSLRLLKTMTDKEIRLPEGLDAETAADVLREFDSTDDAQIINQETLESLREEITAAKEAFAAVLAEESPQSAETLARQDMDALTEPFRDDEGEIDVDTLRQTPETGDVGGGDGGGDGGDDDPVSVDSLSLSDRQEITEVLLPKRTSFQSRGMDGRVEALEGQIAEKFGAEAFDEIESELEAL